MNTLTKNNSSFKGRVIEKTSKGKYKLLVYSDKLHKEIGTFFIDNKQMPEDKITEKDINKIIQFTGILKVIDNKYYFKSINNLIYKNIKYSRKEKRSSLSKFNDNRLYKFTGTFNYVRESDNRALFTKVVLINKENNIHLQLDHLNILIRKKLEENTKYSFEAKVNRYEKSHSNGYFYGVKNAKKFKKEIYIEEMISISKKEYLKMKEIIEKLKDLNI